MSQVDAISPVRVIAPPAERSGPLGYALIAIWIVCGLGLAVLLVISIDPERLEKYGHLLLDGFGVTLKLVIASLFFGAIISLPIAAGRLSQNRLLGALAFAYSYFFRGTPLIAQTFLVYYGAGQFAPELRAAGLWTFFRDATFCAILSFSLNTAAYQAEILAGAIRGVPRGQREAARALGLHNLLILWKIVVPQALVIALRPYGNEVILMIKASAIASIITVLDLMGETRYVFSQTYDLSWYLWAGLLYLLLVELLRRLWNLLERRIARHVLRPR